MANLPEKRLQVLVTAAAFTRVKVAAALKGSDMGTIIEALVMEHLPAVRGEEADTDEQSSAA